MMNGPRRGSGERIAAHGDPYPPTPKLSGTTQDPPQSDTHRPPRRTTPKQSETYRALRPPLRYRPDPGGDYYLPNKHSIQINSYL